MSKGEVARIFGNKSQLQHRMKIVEFYVWTNDDDDDDEQCYVTQKSTRNLIKKYARD